MQNDDYRKLKFVINILFYGIIAVIAFFAIKYTFSWALPFVFGALIALMTRPLVRFCKNKLRVPEGITSVLFVILLYVAIAVLLVVLFNMVYSELMVLVDSFPSIAAQISSGFESFIDNLSTVIKTWPGSVSKPVIDVLESLSETITNYFRGLANSMQGNLGKFLQNIVNYTTKFVGQLPSIFLFIIALILSSIYISRDMASIKSFIYMQIPERFRMAFFEAREFFVLTIFRYLRAYATIMSITFVELSIGLMIIGVQSPILISLLIAVVDILPVFGCGAILLPWAVISFVNQNYALAISLVVLYLIILVVRQIIEPKIVGAHIGLNPLITLFCIYVGFKIMGVFGMFLFPILLIIIKRLQESGYLRLWTPSYKAKKI